jgi:hypothetical protein
MLVKGDRRVHTLAILTCWCIWNQINTVIFRDARRRANEVFEDIKDTCFTWSLAGGKFLQAVPVASTNINILAA